MPRFRFDALTLDGVTMSGEVEAPSERDALRQVERRQLTVIQIESIAAAGTMRKAGRLRQDEVIACLQELATLLDAGVTLASAVEAQARSSHHPRLVQGFSAVSAALGRGQSLSSAMAATDIPLPSYLLTLLKAGEQSGLLGKALGDAVEQMRYDHAVAGEIRQALIYPAVLVASGIAALVLMFTFVIPKFSGLLARAEDLPLISVIVLGTGSFLKEHLLWVAAATALAASAIPAMLRDPARRARLDAWLERLPVLGIWRIESETARWSRVLATLLGNRVPLLDALGLAESAVRSIRRKAGLSEISRAVRAGTPLSDALEQHQVLTPTGYNLIRAGERAGELPAMLRSLGQLCDEAGKARMKQALALLEPLAILLIGVTVGVVMIGIILAITSANEIVLN